MRAARCPPDVADDIQASIDAAVASGEASSVGEAIFNLELGSGAYSCARCHTQGWSYGEPGETGPGCLRLEPHRRCHQQPFQQRSRHDRLLQERLRIRQVYGNQGQGSGRMPGFGALLTDEQIEAVVEYVRSL